MLVFFTILTVVLNLIVAIGGAVGLYYKKLRFPALWGAVIALNLFGAVFNTSLMIFVR